MQLKGTLSFMRVKERRITKAVASLENMQLTEHIIVLCYGRMTDAQRKKVGERTQVKTAKLIKAAKWLCNNQVRWKIVNYETFQKELEERKVIRIDDSVIVESTNATLSQKKSTLAIIWKEPMTSVP